MTKAAATCNDCEGARVGEEMPRLSVFAKDDLPYPMEWVRRHDEY